MKTTIELAREAGARAQQEKNSDVEYLFSVDQIERLLAAERKTWVGLTDEDKQIAFDDTQEGGGFWEFADAIEAKLKEKNT